MTPQSITPHAVRRPRIAAVAFCTAVALAASVSPAAGATTTLRSGGVGPVGGADPPVEVVAPSGSVHLADLVAPFPCYAAPIGTSTWVSPNPQRSGASATMRTSFTVPPDAVAPTLSGLMHADNWAAVNVNGTTVASQPQSCQLVDNFRDPPEPFSAPLHPGANTLTFELHNCDGPIGLDFEAAVSYKPGSVPAGVDDFECYAVQQQRIATRSVTLRDQFAIKRARVFEVRQLCNPARATVAQASTAVRHPQAHLVCRRTVDLPNTFTPHDVRLRNRFGTEQTVTLGAQTLCIPSLKRIVKGKPTPPTGSNPEKVLDHYRCYDVEPRPMSSGVRLLDQFGERAVKTRRLVRLCTPVRKTYRGKVTKIARPPAHLACYAISEVGLQRDVIVRNQFGFVPLRTQKAEMLCVPTFKEVLH